MKEILLQVSHGEEKKADIHTLLQHVSVTRKLEQIGVKSLKSKFCLLMRGFSPGATCYAIG